MKQHRETFAQLMEPLTRRYGVSSVFSDFLTLLVCAFTLGQREEEFLATIGRYQKPEKETVDSEKSQPFLFVS